MSLGSLRALLLTLVMVTQTVAAGAGFAHASSLAGAAAAHEHCEEMSRSLDKSGSATAIPGKTRPAKTGHLHDCAACLICGGSSLTAVTFSGETSLYPRRTAQRIGLSTAAAHLNAPCVRHAQQARAPPVAA